MDLLSDEELKSLFLLNWLGNRRPVVEFLDQGLAPSEVVGRVETPRDKWAFDAEKEIEGCQRLGIRLLTWFDQDYPSLLKQIYDPPLLLYMKGSFEDSDQAAVAIVGTRHPSFYGISQTKRFARELAQAGLTIISGFARGIDQAAHEATLEVRYGRTIAVLGCGLDVDYPKGSGKLLERIGERGAVISEYPLGTPPRAENFPRRNRVISGLSLGVLVVEAHLRSGSLISAHQAIEQGRDVFALPGPVDQLTSKGTHRLIKEGAFLAEDPEDILSVLAPELGEQAHSRSGTKAKSSELISVERPLPASFEQSHTETPIFSEEETELLRILRGHPSTYDELAGAGSLAAARVVSLLTRLELHRRVRRNPDGRFSLVDNSVPSVG